MLVIAQAEEGLDHVLDRLPMINVIAGMVDAVIVTEILEAGLDPPEEIEITDIAADVVAQEMIKIMVDIKAEEEVAMIDTANPAVDLPLLVIMTLEEMIVVIVVAIEIETNADLDHQPKTEEIEKETILRKVHLLLLLRMNLDK